MKENVCLSIHNERCLISNCCLCQFLLINGPCVKHYSLTVTHVKTCDSYSQDAKVFSESFIIVNGTLVKAMPTSSISELF